MPQPDLEAARGEGWTPPAIDTAELLDELRRFVIRYVRMSREQSEAVALWVLHTHTFELDDAAEATPYLSITSAEKQSGKTRLLEVLALLVRRPWFTGRVTAAVLARKTDRECPTLLLDESDAAFNGDPTYAEALRGILNTGHRKGGKASVCVGQGANISYRDLSTFAPKAIAGIGRLPDTVADRSIPIRLRRRSKRERVQRLHQRIVEPEAKHLHELAAAWALRSAPLLTDHHPHLPDAISDRAADVWEPLLAIAEHAGAEWLRRAHTAAIELCGSGDAEDESPGIRLLADTRAVFREQDADRLTTAKLIAELTSLDESPWGDLRGKPLDARGLANRLRNYGIRPGTIRLGDDTAKGYQRADFLDAWDRYLLEQEHADEAPEGPQPPYPDVPAVTPSQPLNHAENKPSHPSYVRDTKPPHPGQPSRCDAVTDNTPHRASGSTREP